METSIDVISQDGLGCRIARARSRRGVSQEDFAVLIGVPLRRLRRIEEGSEQPDCPVLMRVVLLAGVAEDELMVGGASREENLLRFSRHVSALHGAVARRRATGH